MLATAGRSRALEARSVCSDVEGLGANAGGSIDGATTVAGEGRGGRAGAGGSNGKEMDGLGRKG